MSIVISWSILRGLLLLLFSLQSHWGKGWGEWGGGRCRGFKKFCHIASWWWSLSSTTGSEKVCCDSPLRKQPHITPSMFSGAFPHPTSTPHLGGEAGKGPWAQGWFNPMSFTQVCGSRNIRFEPTVSLLTKLVYSHTTWLNAPSLS